jgi:hypothetical protein
MRRIELLQEASLLAFPMADESMFDLACKACQTAL